MSEVQISQPSLSLIILSIYKLFILIYKLIVIGIDPLKKKNFWSSNFLTVILFNTAEYI
jgi:hypothetical protein